MNRKFVYVVLIPLFGLLALCFLCFALLFFSYLTNRTTGDIITEERDVEPFENIVFKGQGTLHLIQDNEYNVEVRTDENTMNKVIVDNTDDGLEIEYRRSSLWPFGPIFNNKELDIYITTPVLSNIKVEGAGKIQSDYFNTDEIILDLDGASKVNIDDLYANLVKINAAGASEINLSGAVQRQEIVFEGASSYSAYDLTSETATITLDGAGDAKVYVTDTLDVEINGAGKLVYKGNPEDVNKDIAGVGTVEEYSD